MEGSQETRIPGKGWGVSWVGGRGGGEAEGRGGEVGRRGRRWM